MMSRPRPKIAGATGLATFGKKPDQGNRKAGGVPTTLRSGSQKAMYDMARQRVAQSRIKKGGSNGANG